MCAIAGFTWEDKKLIRKMADSMKYRGPNMSGIYTDKNISLGHRRLSVIDLSDNGKQPMPNEDKTIWVSYNGEIYNFEELKEDLQKKKHRFYSKTDTEVLVHLYEEYGPEFINKLNGDFAFALWDSKKKRLMLARDFIGAKHLYYAKTERGLIFATEIKAVLECDEIKREVDLNSLSTYLSYKCVPFTAATMFKGIEKLMPGTYIIYEKGRIAMKKYWDLSFAPKKEKTPYEYFELLKDSVKKRLIADVPIGSFLSSGIDSFTVTYLMKQLKGDVKTFTAGFNESTDELKIAKKNAEIIGTDHHEHIISYNQMTKEFPKMIYHMDEPIGDSAIITFYFLSKFANKNVTVAMAGDGADETAMGFPKYSRITEPEFFPKYYRRKRYIDCHFLFQDKEKKKLLSDKSKLNIKNIRNEFSSNFSPSKNLFDQATYIDLMCITPHFYCTRTDKMAMSSSMEIRVPFLDKRLIDLACKLPISLKFHDGRNKIIEREALKTAIPRNKMPERKKIHTFIPLKKWFDNGMREIAEQILAPGEVRKHRMFNPSAVQKLMRAEKNSFRRYKYSHRLYMILMAELWYKIYIEQDMPKL